MAEIASGSIDLKSLKVAGKGASKYITDITNDGIKVASATAANLNYITINSTGMEIFKSDEASTPSPVLVAKFGDSITLGKANGNLLQLDSKQMTFLYDNLTLFNVELKTSQLLQQETFPYIDIDTTVPILSDTITTSKAIGTLNWVLVSLETYNRGTGEQEGTPVTLTPSSPSKTITSCTVSYSLSGEDITITLSNINTAYTMYVDKVEVEYITPSIPNTALTLGSYPKDSRTLLKVGNGTSSSIKNNALELDWSGNLKIDGSMYINKHTTPIGKVETFSGPETSVASNTTFHGINCYIDLTPGTYILAGTVVFEGNSSGRRAAQWVGTTSNSSYTHSYLTIPAAVTGILRLTSVAIVMVPSSATSRRFSLRCWQNSGSPLAATGYAKYVRIA